MAFDVIVIGMGGMGSAALSALAQLGVRALGLEQYQLVHRRGSSHGHTRIIRTAYYEHPSYVPLIQKAFYLWRQLEQRVGRNLLTELPCLSLGSPDGDLIQGVLKSSREHRLDVEQLTGSELSSRYPQFHLPESTVGVLERAAGYLRVEECVRACLDDALSSERVEIRSEETVIGWKVAGTGIEVRTTSGVYHADKLIVTGGAWSRALLAELNIPLSVMRQVQLWFTPANRPAQFEPDQFPIFMLDTPRGAYYGLPSIDNHGLKCARHYAAPELSDATGINWEVVPEDQLPVQDFVRRYLPYASGPTSRGEVCLYTLSPDRHFIIDQHPHGPRVTFACGFSGHGFKFAPTVGKILADHALSGSTTDSIDLFRLARFHPDVGERS